MFVAVQVDSAVIQAMSDNELSAYVPAYGDQIAVRTFIRKHGSEGESDLVTRPVLDRLRDKIAERRRKRSSKWVDGSSSGATSGNAEKMKGNANAVREHRRIEVGWLDFNEQSQTYKQVRIQNGGGLRIVRVNRSATTEEILRVGLELFFPEGKSKKGQVEDFEFRVCTADDVVLGRSTIAEVYERFKVNRLRLNIHSRRKKCVHETDSGLPLSKKKATFCCGEASSLSSCQESGLGKKSVSCLTFKHSFQLIIYTISLFLYSSLSFSNRIVYIVLPVLKPVAITYLKNCSNVLIVI